MIELPKIGEKCQYYWVKGRDYRTGECVAYHANKAIILDDEDDTYTGCFSANLRPIKSEAEKRRDEQIEAMSEILSVQGIHFRYISRKTAAEALYNAGCRMTHKLTADEIAELYRKHLHTNVSGDGYDFAEAIENIPLGEN